MKIQKLTITQEELNEAVSMWLRKRGLDLIVEGVERSYGTATEKYEVSIDIKEPSKINEDKDNPIITTPEQLGNAIVAGEV